MTQWGAPEGLESFLGWSVEHSQLWHSRSCHKWICCLTVLPQNNQRKCVRVERKTATRAIFKLAAVLVWIIAGVTAGQSHWDDAVKIKLHLNNFSKRDKESVKNYKAAFARITFFCFKSNIEKFELQQRSRGLNVEAPLCSTLHICNANSSYSPQRHKGFVQMGDSQWNEPRKPYATREGGWSSGEDESKERPKCKGGKVWGGRLTYFWDVLSFHTICSEMILGFYSSESRDSWRLDPESVCVSLALFRTRWLM